MSLGVKHQGPADGIALRCGNCDRNLDILLVSKPSEGDKCRELGLSSLWFDRAKGFWDPIRLPPPRTSVSRVLIPPPDNLWMKYKVEYRCHPKHCARVYPVDIGHLADLCLQELDKGRRKINTNELGIAPVRSAARP